MTTGRRSPLGHRRAAATPGGALRVSETPFTGKLILQGDAAALRKATGLPLPEAGRIAAAGRVEILWRGPEEWFLLCPPGEETALADALRRKLDATSHQLVDVSDQYTAIALSGSAAGDVLSRLTTLDLHEREFPDGSAAGSLFGRIEAVLARTGSGLRLLVRRSVAEYLYDLIIDAGKGYGLAEEAAPPPGDLSQKAGTGRRADGSRQHGANATPSA